MQLNRIAKWMVFAFFLFPFLTMAQVNSVEFGKNRVQHKKFIWKFYQSPNFNTYVAQGASFFASGFARSRRFVRSLPLRN